MLPADSESLTVSPDGISEVLSVTKATAASLLVLIAFLQLHIAQDLNCTALFLF